VKSKAEIRRREFSCCGYKTKDVRMEKSKIAVSSL
jgi:hypothetical protein